MESITTLKFCPQCKETKSLTEFFRDPRTKDGHRYNCKLCRTEQNKKYQKTYIKKSPEERKIAVSEPLAHSSIYRVWAAMKTRCSNPNHCHYKYYGGRGIKVCERWLTFRNFFDDMGFPPKGYSIDRIDPDGNYEPSNCRWADRITQANNKRPRQKKSTN